MYIYIYPSNFLSRRSAGAKCDPQADSGLGYLIARTSRSSALVRAKYTTALTINYSNTFIYIRVNPNLKGALCAYVKRLRVSYNQNDETRSRNSLRYLSKANLTIAVH